MMAVPKLLGVGSVLENDKSMYMVSGYRLIEQGGMTGLAYVLLPYPLGYVSEEDYSLVSVESSYREIYSGFDGLGHKEFLDLLAHVYEDGKTIPFEQYASLMAERYGAEVEAEVDTNG